MARVGKLAGLDLKGHLDRWGRGLIRRGPADYQFDLANLYRMEAHWALTFARLGTFHLSPTQWDHLKSCLDLRSYLEVIWRSRRRVGPSTVMIVEDDAPALVDGRSVRVSDDYYGCPAVGDLAYPYVMHPWVYALGWHRRVVRLRRTRRRFRVFFAGVVNEGYTERFDFPIMPRPEVVARVVDTFRDDACVVTSRADLAQLRRTDRPIALILFRGSITPMASNHFLSRPGYFRMLAQSRFALCPPGVFMPHSHNLVEAMAVGTVPILNYSDFCRPRLIDGQTCLNFRTPDELIATVRRALATPVEAVQAMQTAVARSYDDELSPSGAARRLAPLLSQPGPDARLILNREFATARLWSAAKIERRNDPESAQNSGCPLG